MGAGNKNKTVVGEMGHSCDFLNGFKLRYCLTGREPNGSIEARGQRRELPEGQVREEAVWI